MMLSEMLYLNTSHRLPQIDCRTQRSTVDTPIDQPTSTIDRRYARSNQYCTLVDVETDTYPSRASRGYLNNTDFCRKYGQQGLTDIQEANSRYTQAANEAIVNAGNRKGSARAVAMFVQRFWEQINRTYITDIEIPPDPKVTVTPARVEGDIDVGSTDYNIDCHGAPPNGAKFNRGSAETYLKDRGFINRWISVGHYDVKM